MNDWPSLGETAPLSNGSNKASLCKKAGKKGKKKKADWTDADVKIRYAEKKSDLLSPFDAPQLTQISNGKLISTVPQHVHFAMDEDDYPEGYYNKDCLWRSCLLVRSDFAGEQPISLNTIN
ncbi:hypothetical protein Ciccas_012856 [Cichlidogyrus casuarinus]|uniref:Uncharacterized protein n=1 Tax=Cichlidogyrus casuarinus TaxID=1844966 RepID=A0ABD2PM85_9PLAT